MNGDQFTIEYIREFFSYDPATGHIKRLKGYGRAMAGQVFMLSHSISVFGVFVPHARLAWALYHGEWPDVLIDHKDRDNWNHRIENLRKATCTENQYNKGRAGHGQYPKGVTWRDRKENPWQAKIRIDGVRYHLGSFALMEEAQEAYILAALEHHGEFACLE